MVQRNQNHYNELDEVVNPLRETNQYFRERRKHTTYLYWTIILRVSDLLKLHHIPLG